MGAHSLTYLSGIWWEPFGLWFHSPVQGAHDRSAIPFGMGIVELKDRTKGDTADKLVLELYRGLPDGEARSRHVQRGPHPDGRLVYVPEADVSC